MDITTLAAWGEFNGGIAVVVDLFGFADSAKLAAPERGRRSDPESL